MLSLFVHASKTLSDQFILLFGRRRKMTQFRSLDVLQYGALAERKCYLASYNEESTYCAEWDVMRIYFKSFLIFLIMKVASVHHGTFELKRKNKLLEISYKKPSTF